jgi:electron transfer flavoprotein alpha subunit
MSMQDEPIRRRSARRPFTVTPDGRKRIILGQEGSGDPLMTAPQHGPATKPLRLTGPAKSAILAVVQSERGGLDDHARQVIAAAALLAEADCAVITVILGPLTEDAAEWGADRVILCEHETWSPDFALSLVKAAQKQFQPRHVLFPDRWTDDGDLGRRLAAGGSECAAGVVELRRDSLALRRPAGERARRPLAEIMLLAADIVDAALPFRGQGDIIAFDVPPPAPSPYQDLGSSTIPAAQLPLEEADFILAAGNGVADIPTFLALAEALGAAVGASRVAVDDGKFARNRQIGATGKTVSASVYMALGISGAIQHLQGIKACRHVIAINQDASAPIAKRADLTVVDDAQSIMLHLLRDLTDPGRNDPGELAVVKP